MPMAARDVGLFHAYRMYREYVGGRRVSRCGAARDLLGCGECPGRSSPNSLLGWVCPAWRSQHDPWLDADRLRALMPARQAFQHLTLLPPLHHVLERPGIVFGCESDEVGHMVVHQSFCAFLIAIHYRSGNCRMSVLDQGLGRTEQTLDAAGGEVL